MHALQGRPEAQNKAIGLGYQPWLVGLLGIEGMTFEMTMIKGNMILRRRHNRLW